MNKDIIKQIKELLKVLSKQTGRGFSFYGSVISNDAKQDCKIYVKNDIELKEN